MENRWYYKLLMEEFGPVSEAMIQQLLQDGTLSSGDLIRAENSGDWVRADTVPPDDSEPDEISDLSELSFDFEESTHQDRQSKPTLSAPVQLEALPQFYTQSLGQVLGPMSMTDLLGMAESGALNGADEVRSGTHGEWSLASNVAGLKDALDRGAMTVSEPVASAPPSTRRLFQTAGKSVEAEPASSDSLNDAATASGDNAITKPKPVATEPAVLTTTLDAAAVSDDRESRSVADRDSRPAVRKGKKKKSKTQEDDKLLNEIFDDVFADTPKSPRGPLPGISSGASPALPSVPPALQQAGNDVSSSPVVSPTVTAPAPVMQPPVPMAPAPSAPAPYKPVPSGTRRGFSFDGPLRNITLGLLGIILAGGLIWKFGLPLLTGVDTGKYKTRMSSVLADFKALGEEPQSGAWQELTLKSRVEFMTYYKAMLEAGATGPENVACMEGLKNVIALSSTKAEEKDKRKELLGKLEKAIAGLAK